MPESLFVKHQLLILNRYRERATRLELMARSRKELKCSEELPGYAAGSSPRPWSGLGSEKLLGDYRDPMVARGHSVEREIQGCAAT